MPYSPRGLYLGLTQSQLDALRVVALAAITSGQWTTVTGGQKTGSKEYQNPNDILAEIIYAEQQNGTRAPRAQKVYQTMNDQFAHRRTE